MPKNLNDSFNKNGTKHRPVFKLIYLLVLIIALASFFLPWVRLMPESDSISAHNDNIGRLITESSGYTPKQDIGIFSDMNLLSSLKLLYAIPALVLFCVILLFTGLSLLKRILDCILAAILTISPIYFLTILKKGILNIMEISSCRIHIGAVLSGIAGIALISLIVLEGKVIVHSGEPEPLDMFEEKEQKLKLFYIVISIIALLGFWLPFIRLYFPSGLKSTRVISMTLAEFIRISPDINVIALFSSFGKETSLGMAAIFYAIPVLSAIIILAVIIKSHRVRRITALVNGVLMITAVASILSIMKDNTAGIEVISKTSMSFGAVIVFVCGVCLLGAFVLDKPYRMVESISRSYANHRISYIGFSILACILFILPWVSLSAPVANHLGVSVNQIPDGMAWPLNSTAAIKLSGSAIFYILYLIPLLSLVTIAAVIANLKVIRKASSAINSVLLILGPVLLYSKINSMFNDIGVIKLRFTTIVAITTGVCLLISFLTDRSEEFALKIVWHRVKKTFGIIITGFFAVVQLYPLVWLVLASFKNNSEIFSGKILAFPREWHFENYSRVLFGAQADETVGHAIERAMSRQKDMTLFKFIIGGGSEGNILRYFMNSTFVVVITVAVVILFGAMASYAISRIKWKRSSLVFTFFILGMMIPVHVALSPLYVAFAGMGLIDSLWSLIIPYIGFGLPISIIVICGFMETIPYEIEESATIDGANIFTVFFKIIMPMILPAISTVIIFVFLQSWNELMFATSFINSGINRTITVGINSIAISQYNTEYALIFAGLVIASLPTIIIYLAGSQQVQKSLIVGAVKG